MNPNISKVLTVARAEIGVREIGSSNTGKRVQEYQKATTLGGSGWPWCAAFVAWVLLMALGKELAEKVWLNSASCDLILYWARKLGIVSTQPTVGCCGLVMAGDNDATHIFIVESIAGNVMTTLEGNTNGDGSREGNGVYRRKRVMSSRYLFVIWEKMLPEESQTWELWGAHKIGDVVLYKNRPIVPAWKWAHWFGQKLGWNPEAQTVTLNGREVLEQPLMFVDENGDNRAWLHVRTLGEFSDFIVQDSPGRVTLLR